MANNIPAWAVAAAAPKLLNDYVVEPASNIYNIIRNIRKGQQEEASQRGAGLKLRDYEYAMTPQDISTINADTSYGVDPVTDMRIRKYGEDRLKQIEAQQASGDYQSGLQKLIAAYKLNPNTTLNSVAATMTPAELSSFIKEAGGKMDDLTKAQTTQMAMNDKTRFANADQEALSNLDYLYREKTPLDAYTRLSELQDVTKMSPETNKFIRDDLRQYYKADEQETWSEPYVASIGGKRALVQRSSRGQVRPVIQDVSTTVHVTNTNPTQQTVFIDPQSGKPLIFDKKTGTYKVAIVEGSGIAPRPINPSASEREKTAAFDTLKDQIDRIKNTYNPKYVGLVSGVVGGVTQFKDVNEAAFRQVINDVKDSLLRARSGAQINEQEYRRLARLVPSFTDSEKQFAGKMKSFETTLDSLIENRQKAQNRGGVYLGNRQAVAEQSSKPQITPQQAAAELARRRSGAK